MCSWTNEFLEIFMLQSMDLYFISERNSKLHLLRLRKKPKKTPLIVCLWLGFGLFHDVKNAPIYSLGTFLLCVRINRILISYVFLGVLFLFICGFPVCGCGVSCLFVCFSNKKLFRACPWHVGWISSQNFHLASPSLGVFLSFFSCHGLVNHSTNWSFNCYGEVTSLEKSEWPRHFLSQSCFGWAIPTAATDGSILLHQSMWN